ncbi:MAG: S8 family serine peptidase, partial [Gammaproteobacteria bacterium]|nr:S8 family serine peptidase [Gammaproteobacteria bacterium]
MPGKSGVHKKLGGQLSGLHRDYLDHLAQHGAGSAATFRPATAMLRIADDYVLVDFVAAADASVLRTNLAALGAIDIAVHKSIVSARVPIATLIQIGNLSSLQFARPSLFTTWAGATTSQGDVAQRSDAARTSFGVDGTGVTVGVLSDSYDCTGGAAGDVSSGDLPSGVTVLQESCPNADEGRAMLQIVHDVAPGAALAFHTASGGQAAFANGINDLVVAGADVIVDDVFYFGEPMFQDGVIAQAADAAVGSGVAYFSSAGNSAAASYESEFRNSGMIGTIGGILHDFDPGPATVTAQPLTVPVGATFTLVMQWNQPFRSVSGAPGATSDLLINLYASDASTIVEFTDDSNLGADPIEAFSFTNDGSLPQGTDTRFFLKIEKMVGPDPGLIKYMYTDSGGGVTIDQFDTQDGTSYGHSAAAGSMSTGAAAYNETPAFGTSPPLLEPFSSRGDVPIYFQPNGTAISPPDLRLKPAMVAPDRVNNTFFGNDTDGDGFPNFGGTSAAAPHAAGAAALLLDFNPTLTPAQIYSALGDSTIEMLSSGFDFDSGFGLLQADAAISALSNAPPALNGIPGRIVAAGDSVSIPVSASDPDGPNPTLSTPVIPGFCTLAGTNGSGNVNCSPGTANVGRHAVVVTAADSGTPTRSDSKGFYVVVTGTATNSAPILSAIGNQLVEEGAALVVPLSATDPNGDGMTLTQSGLPAFCALSDNGNGTGNISCNPLTGNAGTYPTMVTVTDNGSPLMSDSETFDIVVTAPAVNQAPVLAFIGNQSVEEGAALVVPLSATDPNGDGMTLTQRGLPAFCALS